MMNGLRLQPSLRFVVSRWPLLGVWSAHQGDSAEFGAPVRRKPCRIAVHRRGDDIHFLELSAPRFAFWRSLARGSSIEGAASRALARDPGFDLAAEIVALFRSGLAAGLTPSPAFH